MGDYGHDIRLGVFPTPDADRVQEVVDLAVVADTSGIDLVSIQDHPYQVAHADSTTLLTWVAARTTHVEVAHNVASLPLRHPVGLAKWVATLDRLSGGRVHLGLGAGAFWDGIVAAGGPRRSPGEAVDALVAAIEVVRQVWAGERAVRVAGEHYRVAGLRAGPTPLGEPQVWIGAYGPRMQRLTGRLADGWLPSMGYLPPDRLAEANARIDAAAVKAGRTPRDVVRLYNLHGRLDRAGAGGGRRAGRDGAGGRGGRHGRLGQAGLRGTADDWAEQLAGLALEEGMSTFILATDDPDTVRRFGMEVGPALRDLVEAERTRRAQEPRADGPAVVGEAAARARAAEAGVAAADGVEGETASGDRAAPSAAIVGAATEATTVGAATAANTAGTATRGAPATPGVPLLQGISPTPDDGTRLTGTPDWDEESRPSVPEPEGTAYTPQQLAAPQHLIDVHDHLRGELDRVRDVVSQVREGHLSVGQARSVINTMAMRQNNWTLGAFCESYCRLVTGHHTLEDRSVFPHLRRSEPGVAPVIDRLEEEHEVIADVLDQLDRALVGLVSEEGHGRSGQAALDELDHSVDLLTDTLLSHLAYEERELSGPLARHGFG